MAHAILTGNSQDYSRVRIRLEMLGLTVSETGSPAATSVGDCDLVVHVATACLSDVPHRPSGELPPAPLLCLGSPRTSAWITVDPESLESDVFSAAVLTCVDRAWELRRRPTFEAPPERYRDFLSHELRSPLAVVSTTLRALSDSLEGQESPGPELDLLARALRNVERLERTVDWSQRNLMLTDTPPVRVLRSMTVAELADSLQHLDTMALDTESADVLVETDPEVLAAVVQQTVRACQCLSPDLSIGLSLVADEAGCRVRITAPAVANLTPRVARIGLARPGEAAVRDELAELAVLLVPAVALESLGARLDTCRADAGIIEIHLPPVAAPVPA